METTASINDQDTTIERKQGKVILRNFHGFECNFETIQELINQGKKVIIVGDITEFTGNNIKIMAKIKELCESGLVEYVPGKGDFSTYLSFYNMVDECKNRTGISTISLWRHCSAIRDMIERQNDDEDKGKKLVLKSILEELQAKGNMDKQFIAIIQILKWLGERPIYIVENDKKGRNVLISYSGSEIIDGNTAMLNQKTIKDVAEEEIRRFRAPARGQQRNSAENNMKKFMKFLSVDTKNPNQTADPEL